MRKVKVAATQMSCTSNIEKNIARGEALVRKATAEGANIILLQELFEIPYFCQKEKPEYYLYAMELEKNKAVSHFKSTEWGVFQDGRPDLYKVISSYDGEL